MKTLRAIIAYACLAGAVQAQTVAQSVSAILEPVQLVALQPSNVGRLASILVSEGQRVSKGAVLAELDSGVQRARVGLAQQAARATGAVDRALIVVTQAQTRLERMRSALAKGAVQAWEVRQAELTHQLALADLELAREGAAQLDAQLELEQRILSQFEIEAPFAGTVLQVLAEPGEIVSVDTPVLELGNLQKLTATAFVPVAWLETLSVERAIQVEIAQTPVLTRDANVMTIDPRIDPASRSVRVTLTLDNSDGALLPGMAVRVSVP